MIGNGCIYETTMMKVVIDTNILVAALRSKRGASYKLLSLLPSKQFEMVLSVPLYTEYQDVVTRPTNMTQVSSREELLSFVRYLCSLSVRYNVFFLWRPWLKDPKDDMVLELAVASGSRYIITHNIKDFRNISSFGVQAIIPSEFLRLLEE